MDQIQIITPTETALDDCNLAPHEPAWPAPEVLIQAAQTALLAPQQQAQLSICIVNTARMQQLNHEFRQQNKPTNVLAFPNQPTSSEQHHWPEADNDSQHIIPALDSSDALNDYLGDVAICYPIVHQEALARHITAQAHWVHLTIHAVLHLQGYEHTKPADAQIMEDLEIKLMQQLGYPSPYD